MLKKIEKLIKHEFEKYEKRLNTRFEESKINDLKADAQVCTNSIN